MHGTSLSDIWQIQNKTPSGGREILQVTYIHLILAELSRRKADGNFDVAELFIFRDSLLTKKDPVIVETDKLYYNNCSQTVDL